MKIRELNSHEDTACCLRDRCVEFRRFTCESASHDDLAVYSVDAARFLYQFPYAYAYRNVHEYMRSVAAVNLAAHSQILGDTRFLLIDSLRNLSRRLKVHYD